MLRGVTKKQNLRPIIHKQDNFGGGLNSDAPKSEINRNECSVLENYIAFDRYLEGRPGSLETFTLPGSGTVYSAYYHKKADKLLLHRGGKLYANSTEIKDNLGVSLSVSTASQIILFGDDALLCSDLAVWRILLVGSTVTFQQINGNKPTSILPEVTDPSKTVKPYKYRYAATYSVIVVTATGAKATSGDRFTSTNTLIHETPPASLDGLNNEILYYAEQHLDNAVDSVNTNTMSLTTVDDNLDIYHSHITIYRTVDRGTNGLDVFGTNEQLTTESSFSWVADVVATEASYTDSTEDNVLESRIYAGTILKNALWIALPSSVEAIATDGFLFTATRNSKRLTYSQRVDPTLTGFYHPGFQYHDVDDGIQVLARSNDILSIICNRMSYTCTLTVFEDSGILEFVAVLSHYVLVDDNTGVIDHGSFAAVEQGTFIARCNDNSIRLWNTTGWGKDLAFGKISDIVKTMTNISRAVYFRGAYLIYYTDDTGNTAPTACLRLALKNEAGEGWSKYTGTDMVYPLDAPVLFRGDDPNGATGVEFLFCIDKTDSKLYWIETFDGPSTATINSQTISEYHLDKYDGASGGTEIACKFRGADVTGERESFYKRHRESHIYIRNLTRNDSSSTSLVVDALSYVDNSTTVTEELKAIETTGDANFFRNVRGRTIGIEYEANTSAHQVVSTDARYNVEDISHPTKGAFSITANTWQRDFDRSLVFWTFARPLPFLERVSGNKVTSFNSTTITAPDSRSNMVKVGFGAGVTNPYIYTGTSAAMTSCTISFWCKTPSFSAGEAYIINIANDLILRFADATTLETPAVSLTVDSIATGFHHFLLTRADADAFRVYQNKTYKGTIAFAEDIDAGSITLGLADAAAGTIHLWDVRVMSRTIDVDTTISAGTDDDQACEYYYDDVISNSGNKVLPYG